MNIKRNISVWLFVFFLCVYLLSVSFQWPNRNIGEGYIKIGILETLLQDGTIGFPGKAPQSVPGRNGLYYTWHEFGQNFLVLPFYVLTKKFLGDAFSFYLVCALSGAMGCVMLMRILALLGFGVRPAVFTTLVYGLCTYIWFYSSKTTYEHSLEVMFALSAFYFALKYAKGMGVKNLTWCGLSVGLGLIIRNHIIFMLLPLGIIIFLSRKEHLEKKATFIKTAMIFSATLAPFVLFTLYYNYIRFGSPLETGYGVFYPNRKMFSFAYLMWGLPGVLISPGKSMFMFSPALVLFPFGLSAFYRKVDRYVFYAFCVLVTMYILFFASYVSWDGDWTWGPRIFIVTTPFLMMPIACLFERFSTLNRRRYAIVSIVLISFCVQLLPLLSNFYLSLSWRYGVDPTTLNASQKQEARRIGIKESEILRNFGGEVGRYKSFFIWKYATVPVQLDVSIDTLHLFLDRSYWQQLAEKIRNSDTPQVWFQRNLYAFPDLWWLQIRGSITYAFAAFLMLIGGVSAWNCLRLSREQLQGTSPSLAKIR